ncbi:MAG: ThiF family adenylyltransferase (plasmid) [Candidatus Methanoperedens sp.]|nr:MAG: ThiF family adenylyltransferase [Candidatus Methanoperedens sp.]
MKVLIIGCGGIGSILIAEVCRLIEIEQIDPNTELVIADNDLVEIEQVRYQNFTFEDAGLNKAQALAKRFKHVAITPVKDRIKSEKQLRGHDFIILCVDNDPTRELVIKYCFSKKVDFLDIRSSGRTISAFPKLEKASDNLKFVDASDAVCYSCQDRNNLFMGRIDEGNRIVALIGVQMLLNSLRGLNNKVINLAI